MLITVQDLVRYWSVEPAGVIHVGAHEAEELVQYENFGWSPIIWVEAQPDKAKALIKRLNLNVNTVIEAAIWNEPNIKIDLHIMTNTESTSLLDLGTHEQEHPDVHLAAIVPVITKTLDGVIPSDFAGDLISLDIQGTELRALQGFHEGLAKINWIYCEVNRNELYKGCALVGELDEFLEECGFLRMATRWTIHGWGDALYIRKDLNFRQKKKQSLGWTISVLRYQTYLLMHKIKQNLITAINFVKKP
jgi:FkbM family methyltransferase